MWLIAIKIYKPAIVFLLTTLLLIACNGKGNSMRSEDSFHAPIDSTFWLKPAKGVRNIFEDSKGNLWFTCNDYLCMFDGNTILGE